MMACSKNLSKHLKIYYQTKTNKEMSKHDSQSFANLMTFFSKKKWSKYSLFIFIFHIYAKFQIRINESSWHVYLNVFNHIVTFLKNYMKFCIWWCHNHFWKRKFIFSFVDYGLVTMTLLRLGARLEW
jgi:hypothetical protein